MRLLGEAGVVEVVEARPQLAAPTAEETGAPDPLFARAMRALAELDPERFAERSEELAYLANVLVAGCPLRGGRMRPAEAVQAALAICSLGLELRLREQPAEEPAQALRSEPADALFRLAWQRLQREVVDRSAQVAASWLTRAALRAEPDDAAELLAAARRLRAELAAGAPWRAASELDRGLALDPDRVEALRPLLAQCPLLSTAPPRFIASLADLATAIAALGA